MLTKADVWQALEGVKDPEIPVISVVELGVIREVLVEGEAVTVKMTPTFSGCPALTVMQAEVAAVVCALGAEPVVVDIVLHPPWSSDWISEEGRRKLKEFGLAPPHHHGGNVPVTFFEPVPCPRCDSHDTVLKNSFGSTLCRAIYFCNSCGEAFEQFKAL